MKNDLPRIFQRAEPTIAYYFVMSVVVQVLWLVSMLLIYKKDATKSTIASMAVLQFVFTVSIAMFASTQAAGYNQIDLPKILSSVYDWTAAVMAISWFQAIWMGINFVLMMNRPDRSKEIM